MLGFCQAIDDLPPVDGSKSTYLGTSWYCKKKEKEKKK